MFEYIDLVTLSPTDKPWDTHRKNADVVSKLFGKTENWSHYADKVSKCSTWLEFAYRAALKYAVTGELEFKLQNTWFCRIRHCPVCQWRRTLKWRAKFFQAVPLIVSDYPTHRFIFLTLTVRNCPIDELRSTIQNMNRAFTRLSQLKDFPAIGYVKSLEVTRNKETGEVHPHFHILMMVSSSYFGGKYIKQEKWIEMWRKSLRIDYDPNVDIRAVKAKKSRIEGESQTLADALCETLKYGVKEKDLISDPEFLDKITTQLYKIKMTTPGGVFKKYLKPEVEDEDLVNINEEEGGVITEKFNFTWYPERDRYSHKKEIQTNQ